MSYLYKIILTKPPPYLYELMPSLQRSHRYPGCFKLCVAGNNFSVTRFYRLPLMDEINWTLLLILQAIPFLGLTFGLVRKFTSSRLKVS